MSTFRARAMMSALILTGVTHLTDAISLDNFTPRVDGLPPQCQAVYTTEISDCDVKDFINNTGATCSPECVAGLVKITKAVQSACADADVAEGSALGLFIIGKGIQMACPGIEVVTISASSSTVVTTRMTTSSATSSTTSTAEESQSATESTPTTETPTSTGGIDIDTSVPTTFSTSLEPVSVPSAPAAATTTATSQLSNADSGGGSPFDIVATGSSTTISPVRGLMSTLVGAAAMAAMVL